MFSSVISFGMHGMESFCVRVEADISDGMPMFELVGYLSGEVREARERVRTALKNSGFAFPVKRITLNLAPGNIRKQGTGYDLPMAIAILAAMGEIKEDVLKSTFIVGELTLNGDISGISGVLPMVIRAKEMGLVRCIVPRENAMEAALVEGIEVYGVDNIHDTVQFMVGELSIERVINPEIVGQKDADENDLKYIKGQKYARRGLEIAAAGMHNMLMVGAPGAGKSMLAKCIPTIMPPLSRDEALEVTTIYSVAGKLKDGRNLVYRRPFVSPHHTVTDIAMTGGGIYPRPGNISLAHRGVLFLDEMAEFSRYTLEVLRQPMEDRKITIARNQATYEYPADFMLVGAMNPCPCGAYPDLKKCTCTEVERRKYAGKLSKPLLDRMDICVDVEKIDYRILMSDSVSEASEHVRNRIIGAQEMQEKRFGGLSIRFNSQMKAGDIARYCKLDGDTEKWFMEALVKLDISARSYHKILRVARTIADLDGAESIGMIHLSEAIGFNTAFSLK